MSYVIMDLEWNGAFNGAEGRYINEIIEIGAVKLDGALNFEGRFHEYLRPVYSEKISGRITALTGITLESLSGGMDFEKAIAALTDWAGSDAVVMTWSTTDLSVLIENYRLYGMDVSDIRFIRYYADLQRYCQAMMGDTSGMQMGLSAAAEKLSIENGDLVMHHALDDSVMGARCFLRLYDAARFPDYVSDAYDKTFYERLLFKAYYILDIDSPEIGEENLRFRCNNCNIFLKRVEKWRSKNNAFFAKFRCSKCRDEFIGRVQAKRYYDHTVVKRRLIPTAPPQQNQSDDKKDISSDEPKA